MRFLFALSSAFFLFSCGASDVAEISDSTQAPEIIAKTSPDQSLYEVAHTNLLLLLQPLTIPDRIDVDSIRSYSMEVTHEKAAVLFPEGFTIPEEVFVTAFAQQEIDSLTHVIWYKMEVASTDGASNKDIWAVLYSDSTGPLAAHLVATKGVGYGYARIDTTGAIREVFIENGAKTVVTTKIVTVENSRFVTQNEQTSTFGPDNLAEEKSNALIEDFFNK